MLLLVVSYSQENILVMHNPSVAVAAHLESYWATSATCRNTDYWDNNEGRWLRHCRDRKMGIGGPGDSGDHDKQGFDHFYGYLCQVEAHNYYPEYIDCDGKRLKLNNTGVQGHGKLPKDADPWDPASYKRFKVQNIRTTFVLKMP